jgi:circadian clock protein KaiB
MHVFVLYVSGIKPSSRRAMVNLQAFCQRYLPGKHKVSIIDLSEQPRAACDDDIVVIPTLIRSWPLPRQIFVGDLSQTATLLSRLSLEAP